MSPQIQPAYIVAAVRTPVAKARGAFRYTRPDDLLAHVINAALAEVPNLEPALVEDVIIGCAMPEAEQGMNVARMGLLLAGLPHSVPGMTVNRFCCSGLQTIAMAADRIALGDADVILAGGTESMSMVPLGGNKFANNPSLFEPEHPERLGMAYSMGITAELVAKQWQISREQQDEFALASHQKALAAMAQATFAAEMSPVQVNHQLANLSQGQIELQTRLISTDEGPRADTSLAALAKLPPVFSHPGSVTAGNSSQISDGAGAVLVVSEKILKTYNLKPLARFCSYAVAGVAPEIMGIGPTVAIPKALKKAGLNLAAIDWIELNEAFAAQSLAVIKELDLNPERINPLGGAIALGHPLGATGAIRTATLLHGLQRQQQRYGMVTMCIGTGMGAAGIFEAL